VLGALLVLGFIGLNVWFASVKTSPNPDDVQSDAVVMFVGGRGERLIRALELIRSGDHGSTLVIPNGFAPQWPDANLICAGDWEFDVICPVPDPDSTRGEAKVLSAITEDRGWSHLTMVTSDYHAPRASVLLGHCFDGIVSVVEADSKLGAFGRFTRWRHEFLGNIDARIVNRDC